MHRWVLLSSTSSQIVVVGNPPGHESTFDFHQQSYLKFLTYMKVAALPGPAPLPFKAETLLLAIGTMANSSTTQKRMQPKWLLCSLPSKRTAPSKPFKAKPDMLAVGHAASDIGEDGLEQIFRETGVHY